MRTRLLVTAISAAAMLSAAGCFGSSDPTPAAKTTLASPPDLTSAQAEAAVSDALSGAGHFVATVTRDQEDYRQWFGAYSAERQRAVVVYKGPAFTLPGSRPRKYAVLTVVDGADVYAATRPTGPMSSCWVRVDEASPPVYGVSPGFPPQVGSLAHLDGVTTVYAGDGRATVPLSDALEIVGPDVTAQLTRTQSDEPVDVVLGYEGGVLMRWAIEPGAVADAARRAGLELAPRELSALERDGVLIDFLETGQQISLGFPDDAPRVSSVGDC